MAFLSNVGDRVVRSTVIFATMFALLGCTDSDIENPDDVESRGSVSSGAVASNDPSSLSVASSSKSSSDVGLVSSASSGPDSSAEASVSSSSVVGTAAVWTFCSNEKEQCTFAGTRQVRYGTDSVYVVQSFTDGVFCADDSFSDTADGETKKCMVEVTGEPVQSSSRESASISSQSSSSESEPALESSSYSSSSSSSSVSSSSQSSSSSTSVSSSHSSTSSTNSSAETTLSGESLFETQCANCHSIANSGLVQGYSLQELTDVIVDTMPVADPTDCAVDCASAIAGYLLELHSGKSPVAGIVSEVSEPSGEIDSTPVAMHRLNRAEYNNTVRDLFGTQLRPAENFPEDDFGYGFNNIASVLSTSPAHVEQYFYAASKLAQEAVAKGVPEEEKYWEAEEMDGEKLLRWDNSALLYVQNSSLYMPISVASAGEYKLQFMGGQWAAEDEDARLDIYLDNILVDSISVIADHTAMEVYSTEFDLSLGSHIIELVYSNDPTQSGDRNLEIDWVSLHSEQERDDRVIQCNPQEGLNCAVATIKNFGMKVWRRPLTEQEQQSLVSLFSAEDSFRSGMEQVITALLMSPNFIYRPELDEDLESSTAQPLSLFELASRLSYFIWSSTPDGQLLAAAADGTLATDAGLIKQTQRMLADSRSSALVDNFASQWLSFDKVAEAAPSPSLFPDFGPELVDALREEAKLFVVDWFANNRTVAQLIESNTTFLNETLAQHYGVLDVEGSDFEPYTWQDQQRRGILGMGAVLTATSHPSNTSPVKRGLWVLDKLFCQPPPPPPPGVEDAVEGEDFSGLTTRERTELHRDTSSVCYSCHSIMDPIGFGLENYDAVGRWRDIEEGSTIDASGELPSGESFNGPLELGGILAKSSRMPLCVTENLMTYALGRGVEAFAADDGEGVDYPAVYEIYKMTEENGHKIGDIIESIVLSPAFRQRRGSESSRQVP